MYSSKIWQGAIINDDNFKQGTFGNVNIMLVHTKFNLMTSIFYRQRENKFT